MILTSFILNVLLCILLVNYQWKDQKAIPYLIALIFMVGIRQLSILLFNGVTSSEFLAILFLHMDPIACMAGPFFLYYLRSVLEGKLVFDRILILLCLPSLVFLINLIPYFQISFVEKIVMVRALQHHVFHSENIINSYGLLFPIKFQQVSIPIYNLFFIGCSFWYLYKRYRANLIKIKILKIVESMVSIVLIAITPSVLLLLYLIYLNYGKPELLYRFPINNSPEYFYLNSLLMPLTFLFFPKLVYGLNPNASLLNQVNSYLKNRFQKPSELIILESKNPTDLELIMDYLEKQKPYLKKDLSLHDISRELNIPHLRVSGCFNKQLNTSFPEFRNRLRIKHAIELFQKKAHFQMSIEGIATLCGFKNKSSFYSAFKAEYGTTPIEWIKKEGLYI